MPISEVCVQKCVHCRKFSPEGYPVGRPDEIFGKPCLEGLVYDDEGRPILTWGARLCWTGGYEPTWTVAKGLVDTEGI